MILKYNKLMVAKYNVKNAARQKLCCIFPFKKLILVWKQLLL